MFIFKKHLNHIKRTAGNTYRALQEAEKQVKFLTAVAEGYKRTVAGMEKELEFYKNMYKREVKKNEALEKNVSFEHRNYCRVRVVPRGPRFRLP